jgi:hypothetical protein
MMPTVNEALELHTAFADEFLKPLDVTDTDDPQVFLPGEDFHDVLFEIRGHHDFGVLAANGFGGGLVHAAVDGDATAEGRHPVGEVGLDVGRSRVSAWATPQGLLCLTMTAVGSVKYPRC